MNGRKNPNGCPVKATYFAQLDYTNYSSVTNWYVAGHDVADHTVTHVAQPSDGEIRSNLIAMNALAGIPYRSMIGFRAPFLNYTKDTLVSLNKFQFTYDSSASSSVPATDPNTDAFWPYTLDHGMANDCAGDVVGICGATRLILRLAILSMRNVWMVSNSQLLAWMRNPVPASQLNTLDEFKCQAPQVNQDVICNGMPEKEATVVQNCISDTPGDSLNNSPFRTCYGCPLQRPTVDVPNPPQNNASGSLRHRIADNCDTPFWDPIAGKCLNSGFKDETRTIGQNGEGITSTGNTNTDGATTSGGGDGYSTFGGPGSGAATVGLPSFSAVLTLGLSALAAAMFA
ncbi:hypothetical protein CBOM_02102 [Ceraceosorus bombacis]|uniref:Chitin deacetylase n=1 Tax=Ceraceosorus bombacis TaxID=401625 RepID=A0A0P1BF30_9BASI|nr:hypothetical protein CBOM_02102 [Ceraceosorus bombacis]